MQVGGGQQSRWSSLVGQSMQVYASLGKCAGTSNPSKHPSSSSSRSSWARQPAEAAAAAAVAAAAAAAAAAEAAMQPGVNQQSR